MAYKEDDVNKNWYREYYYGRVTGWMGRGIAGTAGRNEHWRERADGWNRTSVDTKPTYSPGDGSGFVDQLLVSFAELASWVRDKTPGLRALDRGGQWLQARTWRWRAAPAVTLALALPPLIADGGLYGALAVNPSGLIASTVTAAPIWLHAAIGALFGWVAISVVGVAVRVVHALIAIALAAAIVVLTGVLVYAGVATWAGWPIPFVR